MAEQLSLPLEATAKSCVAGSKFGRLTVLGTVPSNRGGAYLQVRCDCGTTKVVKRSSLLRGRTTSCGCYGRQTGRTHGMWRHPIHNTWQSMRARCINPNHHQFKNYGGRGITLCDRWLTFENFLADVRHSWKPGYSLDRTDNSRGYGPDNFRWATQVEQARNKRTNVVVATPWGPLCLMDASKRSGVAYGTLQRRRHAGKLGAELLALRDRRFASGGGLAAKAELLTGIEGANNRPVRKIVLRAG